MKPRPFLLAILSLLVAQSGRVWADGLGDGLVGYWPMNETSGNVAHDASGNGNNGALMNYPNGQGSWTSGQTGGALEFGGYSTGQYVSVPSFPAPTTSMTMSAWVYAYSTPPWATVAANWNGAYGALNFATFGHTPNMSLYVADGGNPPSIVNVDYGVASTSLSINAWHFVAYVANAQTRTVTFMQDGVADGTFRYGSRIIASAPQLNIGDDPTDRTAGQGFWNGKIEDLALWNRALTTQELTDIYNAGLAGQALITIIPEPSAGSILSVGILVILLFRFRQRWSFLFGKARQVASHAGA